MINYSPSLPKKIYFPSQDGLRISADFYPAKISKGLILLCHRSHFNRGEYKTIAPILVEWGYSCLAIDQRSGMNTMGYINETSTQAKQQKLPTGYLDSQPDIEVAINFAFKKNKNKPIIVFGSSYSASLLLLLAVNNKKVEAIIAFSPGEYLKGVDVAGAITELNIPIFATSAKKEIRDTRNILRNVTTKRVVLFVPKVEGFHGAKSLWSAPQSNEYWLALKKFLMPS